jgi:hypothetical protein
MHQFKYYKQGTIINARALPQNGLDPSADEVTKVESYSLLRGDIIFDILNSSNISSFKIDVENDLCIGILFKNLSNSPFSIPRSLYLSWLSIINQTIERDSPEYQEALVKLETYSKASTGKVNPKFSYSNPSYLYFMSREIAEIPSWLSMGIPEKVERLLNYSVGLPSYEGFCDSEQEYQQLFSQLASKFGFDIDKKPYISALFALLSNVKKNHGSDIFLSILDGQLIHCAKLHFFLYAYIAAYEENAQFFIDLAEYIKNAPDGFGAEVEDGVDTLYRLGLSFIRPVKKTSGDEVEIFCGTLIPKI